MITKITVWLQAAAIKSKIFFSNTAQISANWFGKIIAAIKYFYNIIKKIFVVGFKCMCWLYHSIAAIFRKVPAELTYWHDGVQNMVQVDDFVELAPNMIQYEDSDSKKRVKVKAEYPIKYILKEK